MHRSNFIREIVVNSENNQTKDSISSYNITEESISNYDMTTVYDDTAITFIPQRMKKIPRWARSKFSYFKIFL